VKLLQFGIFGLPHWWRIFKYFGLVFVISEKLEKETRNLQGCEGRIRIFFDCFLIGTKLQKCESFFGWLLMGKNGGKQREGLSPSPVSDCF